MKAILIAVNVLLAMVALASAAMWGVLIRRAIMRSSESNGFLNALLPARPRRRPFWSIADVLVMLGALILVGSVVSTWMIQQGWMQPPSVESPDLTIESRIAAMVASTIAGLSACAIVVAWLRFFHQDAHRQLGLSVTRLDVVLGLKASMMLLPPVLMVSAAVNYFVPYNHQVLNVLAELRSPMQVAVVFFGTAIATPLFEELFFRGVFQGALQGLADYDPDQAAGPGDQWRPKAFWPVLLSSTVFASLHLGQGAAPIPLFLLALGLGFLYRQTGCLVAPVIVHMVLNGLTLVVELTKQAL